MYDWEFNDVGTRPEMQFALFITLSIWCIKVFNSLQQMKKEKPVFISGTVQLKTEKAHAHSTIPQSIVKLMN